MPYVIDHETVLTFPEPVREHELELRLEPRDDPAQRVFVCAIELSPSATLREHHDSRDAAPLRGSFKGEDPGAAPQVRLRVQRQQQ